MLPWPGWLWRGRCEPREERSRSRVAAAAREKVSAGCGKGWMGRRVPGKSPREGGVRFGGKERRGCSAVSEPRVGGCPEPCGGAAPCRRRALPRPGAVLQPGVARRLWPLRRAVGTWRMRSAAQQHGGALVSGAGAAGEQRGQP